MLIDVLKSKIAYAKLTQTDLYYVGSITIDAAIMEQANIRENERVHVVNLNNGERLDTYAIKGAPGSGVFGLNGPAARKGMVGDKIFILTYAQIDPAKEHIEPIVIDLMHDMATQGKLL